MRSLDLLAEEEKRNAMANELNLTAEEAEQQNTQPEENGERLFTQAEVNKIVRERLARERAKSEPPQEGQRQADLERREVRLQQREWLNDHGLPANEVFDFLDNIDTRDMDAFETTIDNLLTVGEAIRAYADQKRRADAVGLSDPVKPEPSMNDLLRNIFKLGGRF